MADKGSQSSAFVLTLLTFWPPGPLLRAYCQRMADSGARTPGASSSPPCAAGEAMSVGSVIATFTYQQGREMDILLTPVN